MNNSNFQALPEELQQRIQSIVSNAASNVMPPQTPHAPQPPVPQPPRRPSLMEHTIALRQEVDAMRNELRASAQVLDAIGQAVGQLYQTFVADVPTERDQPISNQETTTDY